MNIDIERFREITNDVNGRIERWDEEGATSEDWCDLYQYGYFELYDLIINAIDKENK